MGVTVITEEVVLHIEVQHVCSALNGIIIMVVFMSSFVPSLINYYKKDRDDWKQKLIHKYRQ